ncbi:hypothetical protein BJF78_19450 [Pseudonocardia sp. CNS-139]|nr:hypothetical protein BJF78_19450 [Pseudonocardia sp. CNS-139]
MSTAVAAPPHSGRAGPPPAGRGPRLRNRVWLLVLPALLWVVVLHVLPLVTMVQESFLDDAGAVTLGNYTRLFENSGYLAVMWRTLGYAAAVALICAVLGFPLAYAIARSRPRVRVLLTIGVISPFVISSLVRTFSWQVLLARNGPLNSLLETVGFAPVSLLFTPAAVLIGLVHLSLPLMVLPIVNTLRSMDWAVVRSARSMGAPWTTIMTRVVVPIALPGIEVGLVLVFVFAGAGFVTPYLLGGQDGAMLGVTIEAAVNRFADWGFAAAAGVVMTTGVVVALALYRWLMAGRWSGWRPGRPWTPAGGRGGWPARTAPGRPPPSVAPCTV